MKSPCPNCMIEFPPHLLGEYEIGMEDGYSATTFICPICALEIHNEISGFPKGTPFRGPRAAAMHKEAVEYLKERN